MLFSSTIFIFFFLPAVLFIYYVCLRRRTARNVFLLLASLFFYAWGEPWFVLVMLGSILANYLFGLLIDRYRGHAPTARAIIVSMLIVNLGIIFIFKYLMFTLHNVNSLFHTRIDIPTIILPIGISFFTFHSISYVIDILRGKAQALRNPLDVGLYISLFSQLVAGPIVRYETIADQLYHRKENFNDFSTGACRFIFGLAKKVLLANPMALIADKAFSMSGDELSVSFAWLGVIAYTFQIFFDFSGYSDMAIGLGKMFGFHFLENFNYPYISKSVTEFWRRWHISLSTWFRDYVYFPLGGSRVTSTGRLILNLFVVWLLTGCWHGANWTFICWGLFYFILLTVEKLSGYAKAITDKKQWHILGHVYLLLAVIFGWVLFRSVDISQALRYSQAMLGLNHQLFIDNLTLFYLRENAVYLIVAVIFCMPTAEVISRYLSHISFAPPQDAAKQVLPRVGLVNALLTVFYQVIMLVLLLFCVSYIIRGDYNPFIYFQF